MSDLPRIINSPEASALYRSIVNYMGTARFNPACEIDIARLKKILQ
jgi:hypothetical protein